MAPFPVQHSPQLQGEVAASAVDEVIVQQ